ncbi:YeeE/YedE family protein [Hyphomicrobium sp.]|uniref:YeeE/YedE family protein n=1 Tax=Hyphomicrobium sp. TaxID=82 RepID=UPI0025B988E2|nr:YeeE/YedE family protein [Hyphomicrobium sp.]MCC7252189.1 YeeE/YedE family protein [Hyphomicrobium sp.]
MPRSIGIPLALAILAGLAITALTLDGGKIGKSLVLGALFGIVLQRSRFCFLCHTRDFLTQGDARGVAAILLALAVGTLGYHVILTAWLPDPASGRLPPDAHVGPAGPVLVIAAFAFGIGMAVSGSCISGHLYRLGEGSPTAPFALIGTLAGFGLGFLTWNTLYIWSIATAPVVWLPAHLGYAGWLALQLAALAGLAALLAYLAKAPPEQEQAAPVEPTPLRHALRRILVDRWPATVGGAAVGVLAAVAYFQVQPLGVTAALGSTSRTLLAQGGLLPETLHGLDGFAGCRTALVSGLSPNGAFVIGLVLASFAAALLAGQFTPSRPTLDQAVRGIAGGVLLGWGAMTAIGCTVGTLLSGTIAGAASGWIFLFASFAGVLATLRLLPGR